MKRAALLLAALRRRFGVLPPNLNPVCIGGDTPSRLQLPVLPGCDTCSAAGLACRALASPKMSLLKRSAADVQDWH